jgi:photosystem II stability/assembly factor-like uncharacterized protein
VPVLDGISNPDGDGNYTVSWSAASGATSYTLEEDDNETFSSPESVYSGPDTATDIADQGMGTYFYRVMASNAIGDSDWSNTESVTVTPPSAPVLDSISNPDGDGNYTVSWSAVSGATGYTLEEDDSCSFASPDSVYSGPDTSWQATDQAVGTYCYRVRASNTGGSSDWSNAESTTVTQGPTYDWTLLTTTITETLEAVFFVDTQNGWVAGEDGAIFHTIDGGQSWQRQDSGTTEDLRAIYFTDASRGWAAGRKSTIVRTIDGGQTWESQLSPIVLDALTLGAIHFADANHGWIVGGYYSCSGVFPNIRCTARGRVFGSEDGGESWSHIDSISTYPNDVYFADDQTGWLVGSRPEPITGLLPDPKVYVSLNGGDDWTSQSIPLSDFGELNGVTFADANTGWAVGDSGWILNTADGGSVWSQQTSGVTSSLDAVQFLSSVTGWIVGPILHTADGGAIWATQSADPACTGLRDLHFVDVDHGWAVGTDGTVCRYQ